VADSIYAFGGATTASGTSDRTVINNPFPFGGGDFTLTVDNLGKQVDDYLAAIPGASAPILFGGGNDLFDDDSSVTLTATSLHVAGLLCKIVVHLLPRFIHGESEIAAAEWKWIIDHRPVACRSRSSRRRRRNRVRHRGCW